MSVPKEPDDTLTIGDVVRRTGVAASALHYYEQLGLIAAHRSAGNQRRYPRHMIRRISLILVAKRLGIGLADVREVFATLPMETVPTVRDWQRVSRRWHTRLEDRKREIEQLERELTGCIGCGCLSMTVCQLLNPEDELGAQGPGPRRLGLSADRRVRQRRELDVLQ
ncbi:redox-sensitive transcriptional activator SoxR [Phytohabitans suffuscus]|uniref:redox-sensitive transcriptional activator SoxR n=1 Tax=Phytohabitans suffuscus TaxID=624315 RepID=UPI001E5BA6FE|nr:redox-sensitive transcriptional activator SoxR [Phytohabitans suffuscus]